MAANSGNESRWASPSSVVKPIGLRGRDVSHLRRRSGVGSGAGVARLPEPGAGGALT
jgi:hypothetical protein